MDGVKIEWIGVETDAGRNLLSYAIRLRLKLLYEVHFMGSRPPVTSLPGLLTTSHNI